MMSEKERLEMEIRSFGPVCKCWGWLYVLYAAIACGIIAMIVMSSIGFSKLAGEISEREGYERKLLQLYCDKVTVKDYPHEIEKIVSLPDGSLMVLHPNDGNILDIEGQVLQPLNYTSNQRFLPSYSVNRRITAIGTQNQLKVFLDGKFHWEQYLASDIRSVQVSTDQAESGAYSVYADLGTHVAEFDSSGHPIRDTIMEGINDIASLANKREVYLQTWANDTHGIYKVDQMGNFTEIPHNDESYPPHGIFSTSNDNLVVTSKRGDYHSYALYSNEKHKESHTYCRNELFVSPHVSGHFTIGCTKDFAAEVMHYTDSLDQLHLTRKYECEGDVKRGYAKGRGHFYGCKVDSLYKYALIPLKFAEGETELTGRIYSIYRNILHVQPSTEDKLMIIYRESPIFKIMLLPVSVYFDDYFEHC